MSDNENVEERRPVVIRSTTDLQRLKLEKLMKNPEKPIIIPEKPKEKGMPAVPDFVRNVMGSSAGAGSGEFHVYRHLRRKEYARQKYMKEKGERERLEQEYHNKLEEHKRKADEKTAKKRVKRLKRKQNVKNKKFLPNKSTAENSESENESDEVNNDDTETNKCNSNESQDKSMNKETIEVEKLQNETNEFIQSTEEMKDNDECKKDSLGSDENHDNVDNTQED